MNDLTETASRHLAAIRDELDKATRTLSQDAFAALIHALNDSVTGLTWDVLHYNASPALAMKRAFDTSPALAMRRAAAEPSAHLADARDGL